MDAASASASTSAPISITLDKLKLGNTMRSITVRLMRSWEARNFKRNGELMSLDLLLLDEKDSLIQASIHHRRLPVFKDFINDGKLYSIKNFEVVQTYERYKVTDNKFSIRFIDETEITEMPDSIASVKSEIFRLYTYPQFISLANSNLELPDVVGKSLSVQGSYLDDSTSTQKIVVLLLMQEKTTVRITIWDNQASEFRQIFNQANRKSVVMVCTSLNPKMFAGTLYLNSTGATKFYMDTKLMGISDFMKSMGIEENNGGPTIDDNSFTSSHLETWNLRQVMQYIARGEQQEKEIICLSKIVGISARNGWHYVSCAKCSKKLGRSETSLVCNVCFNGNAIGIVKFRIELLVDDGTGQSKFVIFDKDARKLTSKTAEELNALEGVKTIVQAPAQDIPLCIRELVGKTLEFQVKITKYNFTASFQAFIVTRVIREIQNVEDQVKDTEEKTETEIVKDPFNISGNHEASISSHNDEIAGVKELKTEDGAVPPTFIEADNKKAKKGRTA